MKPQPWRGGWIGEITNCRKDGSTFPIFLSTSVIRDDKGNVIATLGVARDITEQKKVEKTISDQNKELKELVETRDKFFSIISHDLRSPFSSFLGLTEILANDDSEIDEKKQKTILKAMNKSAINFSNLLENLLEWSRFQQGKIPFDPIILNLKNVIEESIKTGYETAKNKNIKLVINIPSIIEVIADSNMLELIIRNLVSNAIKFSNKGGNIWLNTKIIDEEFAEIEVKDNGIGMAKNILNNLFDVGVKTNRSGTAGELSTGMGLILTKDFIEKNDGTIQVESTEGQGSSFYFTLKRKH